MNKPVQLVSKMNGMVLTNSQGEYKTRPRDLIVCRYSAGSKQHWILVMSNQKFIIKNQVDGSVLDVQNGSSSIYAGILCYKHHGNDNQLWKIQKQKNYTDSYYIQNLKTGLVLQIEGGIDEQGMRIVQNKYYRNKNQLWIIKQL